VSQIWSFLPWGHGTMGAGAGKALGVAAGADVIVQFCCFIVAAALQTEIFYDVSASLTYILCVLLTLRSGGAGLRQKVNTGLVITWAMRLGSFLLWRIWKVGHDHRFNNVRNRPRVFAIFWGIQALWILITALPVYALNGKKEETSDEEANTKIPRLLRNLSWRDAIGWSAWVLGFVLQVAADSQKSAFHANPANAGHWTDVGLWRYARHPNYLGEMCMWWGIFLSCSGGLQGIEHLTGISPFFVSYLLLRVSGVPQLRKAGLKRYGHLPEYQEYLRKTRLLVPLPRLA